MKTHAVKENILDRARPLTGQHAREIQPYGTIAKLPIALAENACKASVDNLNQLIADTITLRDMWFTKPLLYVYFHMSRLNKSVSASGQPVLAR